MASSNGQPLAVVTGASSGIGLAVAQRLAQRGHRTVLMARRADRLSELATRLSFYAPSAAMPVDLSDADAIAAAAERVQTEHGVPDVLVNNAGYGVYMPFLDVPVETHRRMMEVNYFAAVWMIRAMLPAMLDRGSGHVISVASISTKMGPWGHSSYSAAKCALVSLMQTLAAEYGRSGVHFSYVNPGIVRTEYFTAPTLQGLSEQVRIHAIPADAVAKKIVALLDRPRLELCVPRHYRVMDWIKAISPALLHRLIASRSRPRATEPAPAPSAPPPPVEVVAPSHSP